MLYSLGYHAEIYEDLAELISNNTEFGIVLLNGSQDGNDTIMDLRNLARDDRYFECIVYSEGLTYDLIIVSMRHGAASALKFPFEKSALHRALQDVLDHAESRMPQRHEQMAMVRKLESLTPRETTILDHLAEGKSAAESANLLGIRQCTVRHHRSNLYRKIGAKGSADAVRISVKRSR